MSTRTTVPLHRESVARLVAAQPFDVRNASIREMNRLVNAIEADSGLTFIRMEFGIPGLPVSEIAIRAEIDALQNRRVGNVYAPFDGIPELKQEASRFAKLFMDVDVPPTCCVPAVGAMLGTFAALALANRMHKGRRTLILLQPGFPVNRQQARFLGLKTHSIDFYDHRGEKLFAAVEERMREGDVCGVLWSSPNNPSWVVLDDDELRGLGALCDRYDVLAIEDLAYFGMDLRRDVLTPGEPPYQATVLKHTRNGISVVSSSKMFSYAGQRIAIAFLHPALAERRLPDLPERLGSSLVRHAFMHGILYPLIASVPETPQYGLAALLAAANGGHRELFEPGREYARRAKAMKAIFLRNGFRLVYDNDRGEPLGDGFYFTISYPGFDDGVDLILELLHYGVSAISLDATGSCRREGLRACVSLTGPELFGTLEERVRAFHEDHPVSRN
ncbi:MAG TPA: pyridoxal phosphate-dependent aminotransferase [Candidatus Polarisedimenticolaceae bacterium]|nr:pyridoxal phosphate-dependent aminotransferase [Candidatus Polarisedimenticolaceae bacterium]